MFYLIFEWNKPNSARFWSVTIRTRAEAQAREDALSFAEESSDVLAKGLNKGKQTWKSPK